MVTYRASNYNLGASLGNVNADNGWGGYQWTPNGSRRVPENLLANFSYQQVNGLQQRITGRVRVELVGLFALAAAIADQVHGYQIYAFHDGEPWGPWTFEDRAISGTNTASNHSRGRAWDVNAPYNGYANGFANITSDIPPALVNDWESIGLSWGGRYGDAMHFEYAYSPDDVAGHEAKARAILGGSAIGTPTKPDAPAQPTDEEILMASIEDLINEEKETHRLLGALIEQIVADQVRQQEQTNNLAGIVKQLDAANQRLSVMAGKATPPKAT